MLGRTALVVAVISLAWRTCSVNPEPSPFCSKVNHGFICTFFNTTEDVVTGTEAAATEVATQHPVILCPRTLNASNDSSATRRTMIPGQPHVIHPSLKGATTKVTASHKFPINSGGARPRNASGTRYQPQQDCAVNVSVQHSTINKLQGHFVAVNLSKSKIGDLSGAFMNLDTKSAVVTTMSVSGAVVRMEDTKIVFVHQLKAERMSELTSCRLGTVSRHGLLFYLSSGDEPALVHRLRDVVVQRLEAGSLEVVRARVSVTNMTVEWMDRDAVTVRSPGELTLTDAVFHCDSLYYCLSLEMGARLVLRNVTIRNRTITKMDIVATSRGNMYPLFALVSKDDRGPLSMTFPWYWVMIMTVCGIVAGIVIGSALVWKRPSLPSTAMFNFTLSDLLSHDRLQEATRDDHNGDFSQRPPFTRQDSGLSSSSFASYRPFQTSTCRTEIECADKPSSYNNAVVVDS
ncbi:uncharacterized protein LOC123505866 isoform X1 [Portunus trituberculatus]|uniref:uncharacterized protein LOC123505866 isoform X1 n=1 Tax=Portunus trituberculatus TaxID=210409 RepID=UPI001E1CF965|nr:uncharacterized protein LOC123505866 isoform X1 [Portunus trituberculatus]XP_045113611.1 uncharacterized protein LOC123505866 isoform X1 [Portunus trituberculatus]